MPVISVIFQENEYLLCFCNLASLSSLFRLSSAAQLVLISGYFSIPSSTLDDSAVDDPDVNAVI